MVAETSEEAAEDVVAAAVAAEADRVKQCGFEKPAEMRRFIEWFNLLGG